MIHEISNDRLINQPLLSVWLITYNHEQYIEKAIRSIVNQTIPLTYEIVVSDDCSTDRTVDICLEIQNEYPNLIRLISSTFNRGYETNFFDTFNYCRGEYIALLEGDDYWTNERPIYSQVSFLIENQHFSGICSNFLVHNEKTGQTKPYYDRLPWGKNDFEIEDLLKVWTIHINTLVFRKNMLDLNLVNGKVICADIALAIILAYKGPIHYENHLGAAWRVHDKGFSNHLNKNMSTILKNKRIYLNHFNRRFNYQYDKNIRSQLHWDYSEWFKILRTDLSISNSPNLVSSFMLKEKYRWPRTLKEKFIFLMIKTIPGLYLTYEKMKKRVFPKGKN